MSETLFNWKRSVLVCMTASLFCCYQFLLQGAPSVMVSELATSFDLSMTQIGFLSSSFLYVYLVFQIPGGYVADRSNLQWLLVLCCLLMAVACYWFSVADTLFSATMARALMGIATAPSIALAMTLVSRWFPDSWFPAIAGLVETMAVSGGALGPVIIPKLMAVSGWREAMQCLAVVGVVLAGLCLLFVRNNPGSGPTDHSQCVTEEQMPGSVFMDLLRKKDFWLCCLYGFGMFSVLVCFGCLWGVPFLCERYPEHYGQASSTISMLFVGAAIGAPLIGFFASITGLYRQLMVLSAVLCLGFSLLAIYCSCSLLMMSVICFLAGFSSGGYMLVFAVVKQVCSKPGRGMAMAAVNAFLLLGGPIMQPLVGAILHRCCENGVSVFAISDYQSAFLPIIIAQLVAIGSTFFFSKINTQGVLRVPRLFRHCR